MKRLALLLAVLMAAATLFGCTPNAEPQNPDSEDKPSGQQQPDPGKTEYKDTITVGRSMESPTLDPFIAIDSATLEVTYNIYDSLIQFDENGDHAPMLATEWSFKSDTELTMKLRSGVKFHNGETMTAEDVQFSLERIRDSAACAHYVGTLEKVEVTGELEVTLLFSEPFAPILSQLTCVPVFSKKAVTEFGDAHGTKPVGAGPYMFKEWKQNDYITLEAFPDYWNGAAKTKYLTYRVIPENAQRTIALENGEIDIAVDIGAGDVKTIKDYETLTVESCPSPSIQYLGMHNEKDPYTDPLIRKAVAHAIDKASLVEAVMGDTAIVAESPCGPGLFGETDNIVKYEYSPEKAKELLKEAGKPDGFKTKIWCRDSTQHMEIATIIQADLKAVGIEAEIVPMEWGAYLERSGAGEHELYILGWGNSTGDANNSIYGLFSGDNLGISGNRAWYKDARVTELLSLAQTDTNSDNRLKYYDEALNKITSDCVVVPLYHGSEMLARSNKVEGVVLQSVGNHRYDNVTVAK